MNTSFSLHWELGEFGKTLSPTLKDALLKSDVQKRNSHSVGKRAACRAQKLSACYYPHALCKKLARAQQHRIEI